MKTSIILYYNKFNRITIVVILYGIPTCTIMLLYSIYEISYRNGIHGERHLRQVDDFINVKEGW